MTEEIKVKRILVTHVRVRYDEYVKTFEIRLPANVKRVTGVAVTTNASRWQDG